MHVTIPRALRPLLRTIVPDRLRTLRGDLWRRDLERAVEKLAALSGGRVLSGPFGGLRYVEQAGASMLGPKLLGTYERELYHLIPRLISGKAPHVVNVGAAEGYYAVGLLTLRTDLRVTAFERSNRSRELLHSLATLNGVRKRLDIRGECRLPDLQQILRMGSSRILIDVEGAERHLLDPSQVPELANASILVEMHEFEEPGETAEIVERFQGTHLITRIPTKERSPKDLPQVAGMTSRERLLAAFERSAEDQEWFWMVPR